ncbi:cell division cycle protein 20 homolog [Sphaeramia orbicularis]|uniref:cell division cycle protein 20 homolog n=1 Tax=Sphaeramia orbicularis TaxID=375764 RepID=UPI00117D50EA|nr:cell division cycle protein 20 homolog B [Sphaeramia orbicularis]
MEPFADLTMNSARLQGKSLGKLAAPSLLNDYYTNLLQCSCNGVIALALGSSVFLWNSETRALLGHLDPNPPGGRPRGQSQSICSLCWSRDGRTLSMGTRRGQIQLWDVEHEKNVSCVPFHLSAVRALSWKQQLLSSGSDLGHIHHHDPRAPTLLSGAVVQQGGVCSLQWSPTEDHLASGSTEGFLHVWANGIASSQLPIITMKQPSSVKAMGWCPWQRNTIATGGGWTDGQLRIWDVQSGTGVTSVNTNSQICSLQWAEKNRRLLTGHGLPDHHITCWSWTGPGLRLNYQLTGHSHRVLHLALNPDGSQMFSAGADQVFHMWDVSSSVCL